MQFSRLEISCAGFGAWKPEHIPTVPLVGGLQELVALLAEPGTQNATEADLLRLERTALVREDLHANATTRFSRDCICSLR